MNNENNSMDFEVRWRPVLAGPELPYNFPCKVSVHLSNNYFSPAVYRWRVLPKSTDAPEAIYIGEAEDLSTRIQRVLTPGSKPTTNRKLRNFFDGAIASGSSVILEMADFDEFVINGVRLAPKDLHNPFKRRALENLLLSAEGGSNRRLLNQCVDSIERRIRRLSPKEAGKLLALVQKQAATSDSV
jgi:hypothetical protein